MCQHYRIKAKEDNELRVFNDIVLHLKKNPYDVLLNHIAPGIIFESNTPKLVPLSFGFKVYEKTIYNARIETIEEKATFKESFHQRRAVFPCTSFFEFDKRKKETEFSSDSLLYLAGIYEKGCFVLLTKETKDEDIALSHPRMPVALKESDVEFYLNTRNNAMQISLLKEPELDYPKEDKQLSLF